jgi:hypothetical protein
VDTIHIGYVLINTIQEHEHDVYNHLLDDDLIIELKPLFNSNRYDLVAKIKIDTTENLKNFINKKIRNHYGVIDIKSYS